MPTSRWPVKHPNRYHLDDLDALWRQARQRHSDDPQEWAMMPARGTRFKKSVELIDRGGQLGPVPRLIAIQAFLNLASTSFFAEAKEKSSDQVTTTTNLYNHLNLLDKKGARPRYLFEDGILALVNLERKALKLDMLEPDRDLLADGEFSDPDALRDYFKFLTRDVRPRQPLIQHRHFVHEDEPERAAFMGEIRGALDARRSTGHRQIINIHAEQLWAGLSACACWIADALAADKRRRVLVVPLRRVRVRKAADKHREHFARASDDRPDILSFAEILGILRAFVEQDDLTEAVESLLHAPPFRDEDNLFETFQAIRLGLAAHPAVIVFDGHFEPRARLEQLDRHVTDDYLESLILRLLDPPICSLPDHFDTGRFATNRIVVMSNIPVEGLSKIPLCREAGKVLYKPLPPPANRESHDQVIRQQTIENLGLVTRLMTTSVYLRDRRTDIAPLLDACVGMITVIEGTATLSERIEGFAMEARDHSGDFATALFTQLLRYCADHRPEWAEILMIVALTPDGLRPDSIARFGRRAAQLPETFETGSPGNSAPLRPCLPLAACEREGKLAGEIKALTHAAYSIFGLVRRDLFEGLDDLPHWLELGDGWRRDEAEPTGLALDIVYPELKQACKEFATTEMRRLQFHALHRLLCDEALQQQTISLRHHDGTNLQSIRPWRRMLSAFYHGLQSIPLDRRPGGRSEIVPVDFGGQDLVSHRRPAEFWLYLYAFCYRRMLERPPAWNLARFYGLDEMKSYLLRVFDKPWLLWPPRLQGHLDGSKGLFGQQPNLGSLAEDWALSLAQAQIASGDLGGARTTLSSSADVQLRPISRRKRELDIAILECEAIDEDELLGYIRDHAQLAPETWGSITTHLSEVTDAFMKAVQLGEEWTVEKRINAAAATIDLIRADSSPTLGSDIADIYFRMAEVLAVRADLASAALRYPSVFQGLEPLGIMNGWENSDERKIDYTFCKSLAHYRFAEQLRLRTFARELTGGNFFASGHQIRQSIRVALKLERRARSTRSADQSAGFLSSTLFARFARRNSDTLTRHLFRYPRERASQIILEATMLRLLSFGQGDKHLEQLKVARSFIGSVEALIVGLSRKARVRLRLALERQKVNREIGVCLRSLGDSTASIYFEQCEFDVSYMERFAADQKLPLWEVLAHIQRFKLDAAR